MYCRLPQTTRGLPERSSRAEWAEGPVWTLPLVTPPVRGADFRTCDAIRSGRHGAGPPPRRPPTLGSYEPGDTVARCSPDDQAVEHLSHPFGGRCSPRASDACDSDHASLRAAAPAWSGGGRRSAGDLNSVQNDASPAGRAGWCERKDAGSPDSGAIGATEDAAIVPLGPFRRLKASF